MTTPDPKGVIRDFLRAMKDVDDLYQAPEVREAADKYIGWFVGVVASGLAATTPSDQTGDATSGQGPAS